MRLLTTQLERIQHRLPRLQSTSDGLSILNQEKLTGFDDGTVQSLTEKQKEKATQNASGIVQRQNQSSLAGFGIGHIASGFQYVFTRSDVSSQGTDVSNNLVGRIQHVKQGIEGIDTIIVALGT